MDTHEPQDQEQLKRKRDKQSQVHEAQLEKLHREAEADPWCVKGSAKI